MAPTKTIRKRTEAAGAPLEASAIERRMIADHLTMPPEASLGLKYKAMVAAVRERLSSRWVKTEHEYARRDAKRIYYLSMEYLIGRSLSNALINLGLNPEVEETSAEPDAGLGNGGLGRLAACFLDSMATLGLPAMGYGLRYEHGIFRQELRDGKQVERPDSWLREGDPWEVARPEEAVEVHLGCSFAMRDGALRVVPGRPSTLLGIPFDRPVPGWRGKTVNTLRLWAAAAPDTFDFQRFSGGDFVGAFTETLAAESLTRVLYPDDSTQEGKALRLVQEYFLVGCSIADLVRRFRKTHDDWRALPGKAAAQLNDTHPALAVPELLRVLLDEGKLGWDEAWDITRNVLAYTNHTLLPEALEKWPVEWLQTVLPRPYELICEINRRLLDEVQSRFPGDSDRVGRMSLVEEGPERRVRMAYLAIAGTHSTNGVAAIHSGLLRTHTVKDFAELYPDRFNNKTNGVTPRRWLRLANPALSSVISEAIGEGWVTQLEELRQLKPLAQDSSFRDSFRKAKRLAKERFAGWLRRSTGAAVDPDHLFDFQVKRIHEYKRQLLNALHCVDLYLRILENRAADAPPRVVFFAGKAAPAYTLAKEIIRFINAVAAKVNAAHPAKGRLQVHFLPDYSVSLAERLIPAAELSEQISTAGFEASGTSNMKFMMNGALTIGTRDGATIEMAESAGEENFFLFGLSAEEVAGSRSWYQPGWHMEHEPATRAAVDLALGGTFGEFPLLRSALFERGDPYRHLADFRSYVEAQERVNRLYCRPDDWTRKAILNVAASGPFSSDRTITEYARDIWTAKPLPIPD
jgi:starch phosphorylase